MEKTCLDCASYLPVPLGELSDFGICLNDEDLEPFAMQLMEDLVPDACRPLLEKKKFVGDRPACPDFVESEIMEIDDDSPLARAVLRLKERGELTAETFEIALIEDYTRCAERQRDIAAHYKRQLESHRTEEREKTISRLGAEISIGNQEAFQVLLQYLVSLPPPATISEVHLKKNILRQVGFWKDKAAVAPCLIDDLHHTPSNNTTRQWIWAIFEFLYYCPLEVIQEPLEGLLSDKRLSAGIRRKIREIIDRDDEAFFW